MSTYYTSKLADNIREKLFALNACKKNPLTEDDLGRLFNSGRSPIRDALKQLESEGIIVRKKRVGIYLKVPTVSEIAAVYDVRSILEGFAARLAAEKISNDDIRHLEEVAADYEQARSENAAQRAEQADFAFHSRIIELSGNQYLINIMKTSRMLEKTFKIQMPEDKRLTSKPSPYSHKKIIHALKNRNLKKCEEIMRSHIQWSKKAVFENAMGVELPQYGQKI